MFFKFYTAIVFAFSAISIKAEGFQDDMIQSFLRRPALLSNRSSSDAFPGDHDAIVVTIVVDNWSLYALSGASEWPAKNVERLSRSVVARVTEPGATSVGWHLIDSDNGGAEISRLTVAWDAVRDGEFRFAASLGKGFPDPEVLFSQKAKGVDFEAGSLGSPTMILKGGKAIATLDALKRANNDYTLKVSLIPPNIDVWGWVKYFRDKRGLNDDSKEANSLRDPAIRPSKSSQSSPYRESDSIFDRKELLLKSSLEKVSNLTIREAFSLRTRPNSVAVGIRLENWSKHKLVQSGRQFESGKIFRNVSIVGPGSEEVMIVANEEKSISGTHGVIRFAVEPLDRTLSVMWSVPYDRQLWNAWAGVGLTSAAEIPSIGEMYSDEDPRRFIRKKSGREMEFSDGRFVVVAEMDGGSTSKPILRVGLAPAEKKDLANSIKKRIGLPLHKEYLFGVTDDEPRTRLVQSTSSASSLHGVSLLLLVTVVAAR